VIVRVRNTAAYWLRGYNLNQRTSGYGAKGLRRDSGSVITCANRAGSIHGGRALAVLLLSLMK
jgi:hypothetical protein